MNPTQADKAKALEPCPFCGHQAYYDETMSCIVCTKCNAMGPDTAQITTYEEMTKAWNTRTQLADAQKQLEALRGALGKASQEIYCYLQTPENKMRCQTIRDAIHEAAYGANAVDQATCQPTQDKEPA